MTAYYLLITSIIFAVGNSCLYHSMGKKNKISGGSATWLFNSVISLVSVAVLLVLNKGVVDFSPSVILWGALYGIVTAVFLISKMSAHACGPIAITTLIGNSSLIIPTFFGILYCSERVTVWQFIGFVLLMAALVLCNKIDSGTEKPKRKWIIWCSVFFVAAGAVSVVFKLHQLSASKLKINEMMIVAYIICAIALAAASFTGNKNPKETVKTVFNRNLVVYILIGAITGVVYNRLNIHLTGVLPSIVFFPVFNGSVIFLTTILGIFFYKEKLSKKQFAGILLGALSILLVGNVIRI